MSARSAVRTLWGVVGPLCVAVGIVMAIEAGLRLAGWELQLPGGGDPYLNLTPFFRPALRADGVAVMRRRDGGQEFLTEKPANGFRVFVLGESSVYGFPYGPDYAFPELLRRRLALALPELAVEVVNCGVNGIGSWHVRRLAEEVVAYRPDVVLVYTGHNDFIIPEIARTGTLLPWLGRLRFFQLAVRAGAAWRRFRYGPIDEESLRSANQPYGAARARVLGKTTLSPAERRWIDARLRRNLQSIFRLTRAAGAWPVAASLTQDLRTWPPGAWRHRPGLAPSDEVRWRRLLSAAARRRRAGDCRGSVAAADAAMRVDPRPAVVHWARARCLDRMGRSSAARRAYRSASDRDEVPLGAPSSINRSIRRVAAAEGVPFVDLARGMERAGARRPAGESLLVDYVHPNLAGHQVMAATIVAALRRFGLPRAAASWPRDAYRDDAPQALVRADPALVKREHECRILLNLLLERRERAYREASRAASRFPELAVITRWLGDRLEGTGALPTIPSDWR